jgi:pyridoxine/pyridoxamine 5'-phosphate oxidase
MAEKKKYQIKVQGKLVPVSQEVYLTYYRMRPSSLARYPADCPRSSRAGRRTFGRS